MNKVFADSSAVIAFFCMKDENHHTAKAGIEKLGKDNIGIVLTDYIFDECITGIMSNAGHTQASMAGQFILESNVINIIWLDYETKLKAWDYFKKHNDKGYSFTDCTSFVLMKEMKLSRYLAFDKHFEQAGFHMFH